MSNRLIVVFAALSLCLVSACDGGESTVDDGDEAVEAPAEDQESSADDPDPQKQPEPTEVDDEPTQQDEPSQQDDETATADQQSDHEEAQLHPNPTDRTIVDHQIDVDDDDGYDEMGVLLTNPDDTDGPARVKQNPEHYIEFCYADTGCEGDDAAPDHPTSAELGTGFDNLLAHSDPDETVVGARVVLLIEKETDKARIEVGPGEAVPDESSLRADAMVFEFDDVLITEEGLQEETLLVIEIGDVD